MIDSVGETSGLKQTYNLVLDLGNNITFMVVERGFDPPRGYAIMDGVGM